MARVRLDWRGPRVLEAVLDAAKDAIDDALDEGAERARQSAPHRSGRLAGEIEKEDATIEGRSVTGRFGIVYPGPAFYGLFHEYRNPFIRPAGDEAFKKLPREVARRVKAKVR